jgi:hypothetical protein
MDKIFSRNFLFSSVKLSIDESFSCKILISSSKLLISVDDDVVEFVAEQFAVTSEDD